MGGPRELPKFVAVTRVKRGREKEFEKLIPAIAAAHQQARPQLSGQWHLLRTETDRDSSDPAVYMFLFFGDVPLDEWDLGRVLVETLGEERGQRLGKQFDDCLAGEQDGYSLAQAVLER